MRTTTFNNDAYNILLAGVLLVLLLSAACSSDEDQTNNTAPSSVAPTTTEAEPQVAGTGLGKESNLGDENCDESGSEKDRLLRARELAVQKHKPDSIACSSILYTKIASDKPGDLEIQIESMSVMEDALYFLRVIQTLDLMGVDKVNNDRIRFIGMNYLSIAESAYANAASDPRVKIHRGLAEKEKSGAYDVTLLQQAIETNPDSLNALAQIRLGRMLFELPSILGGDFLAAIALLEQAITIDSQNTQALYYLAEVYEQEMEEDKAAMVMTAMLEVNAADAHLQISADMLRLAVGLSQRMGKSKLAEQLLQKRQATLSTHPELMTRVSIAVGGHGGVNPLTGK